MNFDKWLDEQFWRNLKQTLPAWLHLYYSQIPDKDKYELSIFYSPNQKDPKLINN